MMKTLLFTLTLVLTNVLTFAQNVYIPDGNFKAYLVGNSSINTNGDTEIQVSEASAFTGTINCTSQNISDLTGIESFTSLTQLRCGNNNINTLDISQNTNLYILAAAANNISTLNVSNNTSLIEITIHQNSGLSTLDITNNTNLQTLQFGNTSISSIDLSFNTALQELITSSNLSTLDVTNNTLLTYLSSTSGNLNTIDLSNNSALQTLNLAGNNLTSLDLSQNNSLTTVFCHNNDLTQLNLKNLTPSQVFLYATYNPNLTCIEVDDVADATANWTNIDATASFSLDCSASSTQNVNIPDANFKAYLVGNTSINTNGDTEIQVSEAAAFTETINCGNHGISDLTGIEAFTNLTTLYCNVNNLTTIDTSQNLALITLDASDNNLTSINLGQNTVLSSLDLTTNNLNNIDISSYSTLTFLSVMNNNLTGIDVTLNTALTQLWIHNNNISTIDLSQNILLETLNITSTNITMLDVSYCPNLDTFYCSYNNDLTTVNMKNISPSNLNTFFSINSPNLTCIEVDNVADATANWTNIDATTSFSLDCSANLSANNFDLTENISIYPTSIISELTIDSKYPIESISLFDIQGKTIKQIQNPQKTIDLSYLKEGVYFLTIESENGTLKKKIIKN